MTWQEIQRDFPHECAGVHCAICAWVSQRPLRPQSVEPDVQAWQDAARSRKGGR